MGQVSDRTLTPFKDEDVMVVQMVQMVQMVTERTDSITFSVIGQVSACRLTQFEEGVQDVVVQMMTERTDSITSVSGSDE